MNPITRTNERICSKKIMNAASTDKNPEYARSLGEKAGFLMIEESDPYAANDAPKTVSNRREKVYSQPCRLESTKKAMVTSRVQRNPQTDTAVIAHSEEAIGDCTTESEKRDGFSGIAEVAELRSFR